MAALSPKQKLFVEYYCSSANFNAVEAARQAGYINPDRGASRILKVRSVAKAIESRLDTRAQAAWYSEDDVLKKLWEEAKTTEGRGNTQASRVNALVWLGKHIGMWKEKIIEKDNGPKKIEYNIINYATPKTLSEKIKDAIDVEKELVEEHKNDELPEGVVLLDYSKGKE